MSDTSASSDATTRQYGVLRQDVEHEIEVKRSRFICYLGRVERDDEARAFIDLVRSEHRLARHHCTAYVLGPDRAVRRTNDDGEPSGTAGVPMLDALTQFSRPGYEVPDLSDVVAVVVRYFGGILLGAGGLVRAYSDAVSQSLAQAKFSTRQHTRILTLRAPHEDAGRWEHALRASGVLATPAAYAATEVALEVAVPNTESALSEFHDFVASLTQGHRSAEPSGFSWRDLA